MKISDVVAELQTTYGGASWLDTMAAYGPEQTLGFSRLVEGILNEGPLPIKIKHYILFIIYVMKGYEPLARFHAEAAKRAGATFEEWHEVLMVFIPSRGPMAYLEGARVLGLNQASKVEVKEEKDMTLENTEQILSYFKKTFGSLPPFVELLAQNKPTLLEGYFKMRSENLKDSLLSHKHKELLLVGLNTAERYQTGIEIHAKAALNSGATKEELLDAMTTAVLGGGIPGWIEASQVYLRVTG